MIIWLNGTFGVGKTSTAERLAALLPDSRILDPETVGQFLRANLGDLPAADFQDWAAWRPLVAAALIEVARMTGQHMIAPQTVLKQEYLDQIFAPLRAAELEVFHVVLDAADAVLRSRIEGSEEARVWRLGHLDAYRTARAWMVESADFVVDTAASTPPQIARRIVAALPDLPNLPEVAVRTGVAGQPRTAEKKPALEDQPKAGLAEKAQAVEEPGLADHR